MSRRVEVFIKNILPAHSHGAYTLVLHNPSSKIQLPVLIGAIEAQAIAMEMEGLTSTRPLTHDLFVTTLLQFQIGVKEVCIEKLSEGIYYASIYFKTSEQEISIDSRTSDAIAIAMKYKAPIFVYQEIIDEAGYAEEDSEEDIFKPGRGSEEPLQSFASDLNPSNPFEEFDLEELETMLTEAIAVEDYVRAAQIRDEITKRK
jgi:bifunctional DNase/RNase